LKYECIVIIAYTVEYSIKVYASADDKKIKALNADGEAA